MSDIHGRKDWFGKELICRSLSFCQNNFFNIHPIPLPLDTDQISPPMTKSLLSKIPQKWLQLKPTQTINSLVVAKTVEFYPNQAAFRATRFFYQSNLFLTVYFVGVWLRLGF